jgi:hypothetical protein
MLTRTKRNIDAREPVLDPTDPKILKINDALMQMRAAFEKRKADPDGVLIELTRFAETELGKVPDLKSSHRFSYVKGLIEKRILSYEQLER